MFENDVFKFETKLPRNQWVNYNDGLAQHCNNSNAVALELLQSCTKPSITNYSK